MKDLQEVLFYRDATVMATGRWVFVKSVLCMQDMLPAKIVMMPMPAHTTRPC
jgi:hypothetical protein